jgi:hypothetical protein
MATDTCKFCDAVASFYDEPNCSSLVRAYGCAKFDDVSRKRYPTAPPAVWLEAKAEIDANWPDKTDEAKS